MDEITMFHAKFVECKSVFDAISTIIECPQMELDEAVGERMCESLEDVRKSLNWLITSLACCA